MLLRRRVREHSSCLQSGICPFGNAPSADGVCRCDSCLLVREDELTRDPVFSQWRFCNVFREDDRTTIWFRENLRDPLKNDAVAVLRATVVFRWFNRIETGEIIKPMLLSGRWNSNEAKRLLWLQEPVVTGAFMVKTPSGRDKLSGVCWCIDQVEPHLEQVVEECGGGTLEAMWQRLKMFPFFGPFMSYEVVSDLRHTVVCSGAPDIMTWANPGPGCTRGLGRVVHGDPEYWNETSATARAEMLNYMGAILYSSQMEKYWPQKWPTWEMREVEHWACEFDKYQRGSAGEKLKRRYP